MRVMITGGSGMVGKNFLEHPLTSQFQVVSPSSSELNLFDYFAVEQYLNKYKPDIIIHAAGCVGGIQANLREPVKFLLENLDMGRNLVWAARQTGIPKIINLGSSCMYPREAVNPLKEEYILQGRLEPTNEGYALAKVTIARLCEYISRQNPEFQYKTLIPCNLYGRWDKFDPKHSHLIPAVILKIKQAVDSKQDSISIWGDGLARREFMYAGDFADCLVKAILEFESIPMSMNVGLGFDYSILEYYRAVANVIGYNGQFIHDLTKPTGMQQKLVDISQQKSWGWKHSYSLHDGIRKTYNYLLENINTIKLNLYR